MSHSLVQQLYIVGLISDFSPFLMGGKTGLVEHAAALRGVAHIWNTKNLLTSIEGSILGALSLVSQDLIPSEDAGTWWNVVDYETGLCF